MKKQYLLMLFASSMVASASASQATPTVTPDPMTNLNQDLAKQLPVPDNNTKSSQESFLGAIVDALLQDEDMSLKTEENSVQTTTTIAQRFLQHFNSIYDQSTNKHIPTILKHNSLKNSVTAAKQEIVRRLKLRDPQSTWTEQALPDELVLEWARITILSEKTQTNRIYNRKKRDHAIVSRSLLLGALPTAMITIPLTALITAVIFGRQKNSSSPTDTNTSTKK